MLASLMLLILNGSQQVGYRFDIVTAPWKMTRLANNVCTSGNRLQTTSV